MVHICLLMEIEYNLIIIHINITAIEKNSFRFNEIKYFALKKLIYVLPTTIC